MGVGALHRLAHIRWLSLLHKHSSQDPRAVRPDPVVCATA
jgi:hypothetical protein